MSSQGLQSAYCVSRRYQFLIIKKGGFKVNVVSAIAEDDDGCTKDRPNICVVNDLYHRQSHYTSNGD